MSDFDEDVRKEFEETFIGESTKLGERNPDGTYKEKTLQEDWSCYKVACINRPYSKSDYVELFKKYAEVVDTLHNLKSGIISETEKRLLLLETTQKHQPIYFVAPTQGAGGIYSNVSAEVLSTPVQTTVVEEEKDPPENLKKIAHTDNVDFYECPDDDKSEKEEPIVSGSYGNYSGSVGYRYGGNYGAYKNPIQSQLLGANPQSHANVNQNYFPF